MDVREPSKRSSRFSLGRLTFRGLRQLLASLLSDTEVHGNAQELLIAVSVPHKQFLVLLDVSTTLIKYLPLVLHGQQVLLLGEPSTVDIGHPVPRTFAVDKMAQVTVFKNLNKMRHAVVFLCVFILFWSESFYVSEAGPTLVPLPQLPEFRVHQARPPTPTSRHELFVFAFVFLSSDL